MGVHDPGLQPPGLTPGYRCGSMGSRRSCSSLLGSSPKCPPNQSPPKWTAVSQAGRVSRDSGRPGLCACPRLPVFLLSFCPCVSELIYLPPVGTTAAFDKAKLKPTVSQGDQQVRRSQGRREEGLFLFRGWPRETQAVGPTDAGPLSPQGLSGKDKELVLGLGHLNNSYNFSVSVCEHLRPHLPPEWGTPRLSPHLPSSSPLCPHHPVPRGHRLSGRGRPVQPQLPQLLQLKAGPGAALRHHGEQRRAGHTTSSPGPCWGTKARVPTWEAGRLRHGEGSLRE